MASYSLDPIMNAKTSDEYIAALEKKLMQVKGPKNATAGDLINSISGMRSLVLYDALMNSENSNSPNVPSEDIDPLLHFDLLNTLHSTLLEEEP
ncbi:hypothetical protein TcWFU_002608 [Taenia crassiceps]|uniref:Uncharacterized protein n=1 Tax=Taenia crassiceps TaxID=6207 RepID=A0ABR4Q1R2_9CEST